MKSCIIKYAPGTDIDRPHVSIETDCYWFIENMVDDFRDKAIESMKTSLYDDAEDYLRIARELEESLYNMKTENNMKTANRIADVITEKVEG